eukprot:CCRYP_019694-RB/>CCRYP_019694-RB protein AED:0.10 eAED:0.10 QI:316/1/1/1/1/1/2/351/294
MKLFTATAFSSLFFAEEGAAQTARLRNKSLYKSAGSQRQLQIDSGDIFGVPVDATVAAFNPTEVPVVTLSISLSLPPILTPPILTIQSTVAAAITSPVVPSEPNMDVELSMSAPEAPILPDTIPAIDTTVTPTTLPQQTTTLPQTSEFGVPIESASISMSLPFIADTTVIATTVLPTLPAVTNAATTAAAATTVVATSELPPITTEPMCMSISVTTASTELPLLDDVMCMSNPVITGSTEWPLSDEAIDQMSMQDDGEMSVPPLDYIPPIDESVAPTKMPTNWFDNAQDSFKSR